MSESEVSRFYKVNRCLQEQINFCNRELPKTTSISIVNFWQKQLDYYWELEQQYYVALDNQTIYLQKRNYLPETFNSTSNNYNTLWIRLENLRDQLKATSSETTAADRREEVDVRLQLLRQQDILENRFESVCNRAVDSDRKMQPCEIDIEREIVKSQYAALEDISLQRAAQGVEKEVLVAENGVRLKLYREALLALMVAQPELTVFGSEEASGAEALNMSQLQIAEFNGSYSQWVTFRESFEHVHQRTNLSANQKLQYLKAYLSGEASKLVSHLELTEDNYALAWALLNKHYNNKRELFASHIRAVTSIPKCSGTADDLRRLHSQITKSLMPLQSIGHPADVLNDLWIVFNVCDKLDTKSRLIWEHSCANVDLPTWDDLDTFLQERIRALSAASALNLATDSEDKSLSTSEILPSDASDNTNIIL